MARGADGRFSAITWDDAIARLAAKVTEAGGKLAVLSGAGRGTFSDLLAEWTGARWAAGWCAGSRSTTSRSAPPTGRSSALDQLPAHDFASAKYIVSFGADFLDTWLSPIEHQRGFADVARLRATATWPSSSTPRRGMDLTGLNADEWLAIAPGTEAALALAMANVVRRPRGARRRCPAALARFTPAMAAQETGRAGRADRAHRAGVRGGAAEPGGGGRHRRAARRRHRALRRGQPAQLRRRQRRPDGQVRRRPRPPATATPRSAALAQAMDGGQVGVLLVHDANPVYALPKAAGFAEQAQEGGVQGLDRRCSSTRPPPQCDLLLPQHHALERWDDLAPRAGVRSLMQPVMEPVFDTRAAGDVLLKAAKKAGGALAKFTAPTWEAHLRSRWQALAGERKAGDADEFWRAALQRGGVFDDDRRRRRRWRSARRRVRAAPTPSPRSRARASSSSSPTRTRMLYDGRGANKPWLLENADPVTKITWHSWVEVEPETATPPRRPERRDPPAHVAARRGRGAGLHLSRAPSRTWSAMPLGLRPHRLRRVRPGPRASTRSTCSARRPATSCPTSPPGSRSRRPAATASSRPSRACRASSAGASPRPCRSRRPRRASRSRRRTSRRGTPSTRSTPSARSRRSRAGARASTR